MKIPLTDLPAVVAQFLETELLPKAVGMKDKAKVSAMIAIVILRGKDLVTDPAMVEPGKLAGFIDANGHFDLDYGVRFAEEVFKRQEAIEFFGITFNKQDVQTMYNIAQNIRR